MRYLLLLVLAALLTAAGGPGLDQGITDDDLDRIAPGSNRLPGDNVWGGYLKSEADMLPPLSIRFDDFGADNRGDQALMALEFLKRGIPISIGVNAWFVDSAADSARMDSILTFEREFGTEVEWYQHTNGNMIPDRTWPTRGVTTARGVDNEYVILNDFVDNTDWRYYYSWKWSDWVAELDPSPIERMTGERPTYVVWPGNGNPLRSAYVRRNFSMFEDLFDTLGYEFGVSGFASGDSSFRAPDPVGPVNVPTAGSQLQPFMYADWPFSKVRIPMDATLDLDTEWYVERFAPGDTGAPDWVPQTSANGDPMERWTFAENVDNYSDGDNAASGDYAVANAKTSFRRTYTRAAAAGGGMSLVFHSEAYTNNDAANVVAPTFPNGTTNTHTGNRIDIAYIAAACSALVDAGFFQPMTVGEHVRWLSKKPGKRGMRIGGARDFVPPWLAIGDSAGVEINMFAGMGLSGGTNAYPANGFTSFSNDYGDTDFDGKMEGWHYGTDATESVGAQALAIVDGYGQGGRDGMILQLGGANETFAWLFYAPPMLVPGKYQFSFVTQNTQAIHAQNDATLQPVRWVTRPEAGDVGRSYVFDFITDASSDTTQIADAADSWSTPTRVQELIVDFSEAIYRDQWITDDIVSDFSSFPWYEWAISFTVPDESDRLAESSGQIAVMERWLFNIRLAMFYSSSNEHPRISSVALRWMGPVE